MNVAFCCSVAFLCRDSPPRLALQGKVRSFPGNGLRGPKETVPGAQDGALLSTGTYSVQ